MSFPPASRVAVVGAGIVGICSAIELAEAGFAVTLFDPAPPAEGGPSAANAGHIAAPEMVPLATPGIAADGLRMWFDREGGLSIPLAYLPRIAPWLFRLWRESAPERFRHNARALAGISRMVWPSTEDLYARVGILGEIRNRNALYIYETPDSLEAGGAKWALRADHGFAAERIDAAELRRREPGLAEGFAGAYEATGWQHVSDPLRVARLLFEYAQGLGVQLSQARVGHLEPSESGVTVRLASGAAHDFDAAVVAAGAWSTSLTARLGDRVPLDTERGYNITVPEPGVEVGRPLVFADRGFVATPLDTGLRIGGMVELGGVKAPPRHERTELIIKLSRRFLPGLRTEGCTKWMGHRPSLPDSLPVIGRSRASARVLYAFGHGHLGLTQAPATALLVRDLAAGATTTGVDIAAFSPARFMR